MNLSQKIYPRIYHKPMNKEKKTPNLNHNAQQRNYQSKSTSDDDPQRELFKNKKAK